MHGTCNKNSLVRRTILMISYFRYLRRQFRNRTMKSLEVYDNIQLFECLFYFYN